MFGRVLLLALVLLSLFSTLVYSSPLNNLDPKLRAIIESDPELMAELQAMIQAGTFPSNYDNARLFNYQRLG